MNNQMRNERGGKDGGDREWDVDWQAFLYVAGEMVPEEAAAFEHRLAEEVECCEAVARAMELAEVTALAAAYTPEPGRSATLAGHRKWLRRLGWMTCGAAACLSAVWAGILMTSSHSSDAAVPSRVSGTRFPGNPATVISHDLALAWASSRTEFSEPEPVAAEDAAGLALLAEGSLDNTWTSEYSEIETPSWMLIGVTGLAGEMYSPEEAME